MKKTLIITILILAIAAILWHRSARAAENKQPSQYLCPPVSSIQKDPVKLNWFVQTTEGYWKSYKISFASQLVEFTGAEWVGENVGQIFCVYSSKQNLTIQGQSHSQPTLPVVLVFGTLTKQPSGFSWTHPRQGVYMCKSEKLVNCPFLLNEKSTVGNIYQQAESLKD